MAHIGCTHQILGLWKVAQLDLQEAFGGVNRQHHAEYAAPQRYPGVSAWVNLVRLTGRCFRLCGTNRMVCRRWMKSGKQNEITTQNITTTVEINVAFWQICILVINTIFDIFVLFKMISFTPAAFGWSCGMKYHLFVWKTVHISWFIPPDGTFDISHEISFPKINLLCPENSVLKEIYVSLRISKLNWKLIFFVQWLCKNLDLETSKMT